MHLAAFASMAWTATATAVELTVQIDVSILWTNWVGFAPSIGPLIPQPPNLILPNLGKLQGNAPNPNPKTSICTVKPTAVTVAV